MGALCGMEECDESCRYLLLYYFLLLLELLTIKLSKGFMLFIVGFDMSWFFDDFSII